MKIIFLLFLLFPLTSRANGLLNKSEFNKLTPGQKAEVLKAYREFIGEISRNTDEEFETITSINLNFNFIEEAIAADSYDCFYGGWPSRKKTLKVKGIKRTFCSSPLKSNTGYQKLSQACGPKQMLCQPVLFGSGLCIEAKTAAQRNSAFSQCQKLSMNSGKTVKDIVKEASSNENAVNLDELFELVHKVCGSGFQSNTGMCSSLKAKVASIKAESVEKAKDDTDAKNSLVKAVEAVNEGNEKINEINNSTSGSPEVETQCADTDEETVEKYTGYSSSEPVDQGLITPPDYCTGIEKGNDRQLYSRGLNESTDDVDISIKYQGKMLNDAKSLPGGYSIRAEKLGAGQIGIEEGKETPDDPPVFAERSYKNSFLGRGKESSFEIIDLPVRENYEGGKLKERFLSTNLRITQYAFFPRKVVPSVKIEKDKIIMKMTTGEVVLVDPKSGQVVGGAAKEVPTKTRVETRTDDEGNKNIRTYPEKEFSYSGDGLYIQTLLSPTINEKDPGSVVPVKARVNGVDQECKLKSEDIWVKHKGHYLPESHKDHKESYWYCTKYKFEKDEDLYELIKKTCPEFKFPALVK